MWLIVGLVITGIATAHAAPPSGYQCGPGKVRVGVGCSCPASHLEGRDQEGTAICVAKPKPVTYEVLIARADNLDCAKSGEVYNKALALKPTGVEAHIGLGYCAIAAKDNKGALARFTTALKINPRNEEAWWGSAVAYISQGNKTEAVAFLNKYLEAFPDSERAQAVFERLTGTPAPQRPAAQSRGPTTADIEQARKRFVSGRQLFDARKYEDAAGEFKESLRLSKNPLLHYNIGLAFDNAGSWDLALYHYKKFLEDAPETAPDRAGLPERVRVLQEKVSGKQEALRGASLGTIPSYENAGQTRGLVLADVVADGPAARAGLRAGDRIIRVGSAEITVVEDFIRVLESAAPDTQVTISFVRDGKVLDATATYAKPRPR